MPRPSFNHRQAALRRSLHEGVLVLDGAMGTAIQDLNLKAEDFGGNELEGCNENLVLTRPDLIRSIHENYLKTNCDIIETNSFGGTPLVLAEYGLEHQASEINKAAARIAREVADLYSTPEKPRFVAGSMGPTTKSITVTGGISFTDLKENYRVQAKALMEGKCDYLLIETCQDSRNIKAALLAIDDVESELGIAIPVAVSGTIEASGTMLAGQSVEALYASLAYRDLLYIGLNCATGPEFMTDHIRSLAELAQCPVACVPNAGLPDEEGKYLETPEMLARVMGRFIESGWVNLVGGCCGTHASHIAQLVRIATGAKPRVPTVERRSFLSGIDYLEVTNDVRPVLVGERTNVIGSKKFKTLVCEEKFEEASEVARSQVKGGASIIDICLANPDRDELKDMRSFLNYAAKKIRAPIMIDSTDEKVLELALTYCQGKAIINSINLEDGEERFEKVIPLAKRYGAALVVGTIDDDPKQGMGVTRVRKLEIAERAYRLLTEKYGIEPEDIYWDPLVFPCATGDANYTGSAAETIEGLRAIKVRFPGTKTVLGISNVSFGLPPSGREVLNSVFLYHCVQAGLDLAIVNSEKLERYASLGKEERELSENLLFNRGTDPIAAFAAHFRKVKVKIKTDRSLVPLDERLAQAVVEGSKEGLIDDLNEALKERAPLVIINGPLMKGMDEVGRLFNENRLIVAEVLQSAEVMKAAVTHLEPFMERTKDSSRGKVLLATVKGDVHDIGKNLVDIILTNNGFEVVNLGIKIPPEQLIDAIHKYEPNIVGLSGLLVKSAQQMVATAEDFARAGVKTPMLVGGAALSEAFVDKKIAKAYETGTVAYASDAMTGLDLAKSIVDPDQFSKLQQSLTERRDRLAKTISESKAPSPIPRPAQRSGAVPILASVPVPPDFDRHVLRNTPIEQIWKFINPLMLYGRHLGIKGSSARLLDQIFQDPSAKAEVTKLDPKAYQVWEKVEEVKTEFKGTEILAPVAVYQFFKASSQGNRVIIDQATTFDFPRQPKDNGLSLADYLLPSAAPNAPDNLACFVVSIGRGVRELAESLKNRGDYLKSHVLQALAIESAEAYAELLHSQIRKTWGFPDPPDLTMMQRFQAKYSGKRYSFGYPACPRLDDQRPLFDLLRASEIGVELTEGFMMDPEASVSAIVFHHPSAVYFSVGSTGETDDPNR